MCVKCVRRGSGVSASTSNSGSPVGLVSVYHSHVAHRAAPRRTAGMFLMQSNGGCGSKLGNLIARVASLDPCSVAGALGSAPVWKEP